MSTVSFMLLLVVHLCVAPFPSPQSNADRKLRGCDENHNPGVMNEFGPLPPLQNYNQVVYPSDPDTFQGRNMLQNYYFKYMEFQRVRPEDAPDDGYAYNIFAYMNKGVLTYLDYLRVDPEKWQYVVNAVLTVNGPDLNGIIRIRFLMSDCRCRMRQYNLNDDRIVDNAKTLTCDGKFLISTPPPPEQPRGKTAPGCVPGNNPGIYNFKISAPSQEFKRMHYRRPTTTSIQRMPALRQFTIQYGTCEANREGYKIPLFCIVVEYNGVVIDYIKIKSFEKDTIKEYGMKYQRGYDYAQALKIQPVVFDGQTRLARIKFLMDDCTCKEREYRWTSDRQEEPVTLPCEDFGPPADSTLWQPPSVK